MKKVVSFSTLAFIALLLTSLKGSNSTCGKQLDCPGFADTALAQWFPYADNDQPVSLSNSSRLDPFILNL